MKKVSVLVVTLSYLFFGHQGWANSDLTVGIDAFENGEYERAIDIFNLPAERGNAQAQYYLALMYLFGAGIEQNNNSAFSFLKLSANQGYVSAQTLLGSLYAKEPEKVENLEEAEKWLQRSADKGDSEAQYLLAMVLAQLHGIDKGNVNAYAWALISCGNYNKIGCNFLHSYEFNMAAIDIQKAQKLADNKLKGMRKIVIKTILTKQTANCYKHGRLKTEINYERLNAIYTGETCGGVPDGNGKIKGKNTVYEGTFENGIPSKKGKITTNDMRYDGEIIFPIKGDNVPNCEVNNLCPHGSGKMVYPSMNIVLNGTFVYGSLFEGTLKAFDTALPIKAPADTKIFEEGKFFKGTYKSISDIEKDKATKRKIEEEKARIEIEQSLERIKNSKQNFGFRDIRPGLTESDILSLGCKDKQDFLSLSKQCYGIDNISFIFSYNDSGLLDLLILDMGAILDISFLGQVASLIDGENPDIFSKTFSTLSKKYITSFKFSERERQLYNEYKKSSLYIIFEDGKVAMRIQRLNQDSYLYVEYRDTPQAKLLLENIIPITAKESDF